jgi:hypothetical protein
MLAHGEESEGDRLKASGLSRTTYHESRRHIYGSRWIEDRYVPDPRALGCPWMAIGLSRPLADRSDEYVRQVAALPGAVVLWALSGCALGVFFLHDPKEVDYASRLWTDAKLVRDSEMVVCEPTPENVPVYFDCEGLWAHLIGRDGTSRYPRSLGIRGPRPQGGVATRGISEMLGEAGQVISSPGPVYLHRTMGLRRSHRVLVEKGFIARRVFLGSGLLPAFDGRDLTRMLFVTGKTGPGFRADTAFPALVTQARVFPHIVAAGNGKMVIGFMGQGGPPPGDSRPPASFGAVLLPVLKSFLSDINIFQGDTTTLTHIVDHRYDRLAAPPQ